MKVDRRGFLKLAGFAGLGFALKPVVDVFSRAGLPEVHAGSETKAGQSFGMIINPKACREGCTACIDACHSIHNIPDINDSHHEIKWIWTTHYESAFPDQHNEFAHDYMKHIPIPILCNHCENPACVRVCPTGATWKRKNGIVMMDYHRCIGCRFCMAACPYGARSFNWKDPRPFINKLDPGFPTRSKGVVEKCNFCDERLTKGLLPACVEACEAKALIFGNLADPDSEVTRLISSQYSIRRKPGRGTEPKIYYLI